VAWDAPEHYGVACKRTECRDPATRSPFNSRRSIRAALAAVIETVPARLVVLSYNDEAWVTLEELVELCRCRGEVAVLAFDSPRYVGARIGIHNPGGQKVGRVGRLRNVEYLLVAGEHAELHQVTGGRLAAPALAA
jgi:adenine-specific DNA-methyltransferase